MCGAAVGLGNYVTAAVAFSIHTAPVVVSTRAYIDNPPVQCIRYTNKNKTTTVSMNDSINKYYIFLSDGASINRYNG